LLLEGGIGYQQTSLLHVPPSVNAAAAGDTAYSGLRPDDCVLPGCLVTPGSPRFACSASFSWYDNQAPKLLDADGTSRLEGASKGQCVRQTYRPNRPTRCLTIAKAGERRENYYRKASSHMKRVVGMLLVLSATAFKPSFQTTAADSPASTVALPSNSFGTDLYGQLAKEQPGKNLFFSPASISMALAMTAAGSAGQTETEMASVLHLTGILPQAHDDYRKALERWNSAEENVGYTLRVANRLWGQKSFPFLASFLEKIRQNYGAELGPVDFMGHADAARQEINAWIEKQTDDKIKDLLSAGVVDSNTRLVLTNAIYFKGNWASRFEKSQTQEADFSISADQKVKTPLMHQKQSFSYVEADDVQVLELPYEGHNLSMFVLLPKAEDGLAGLEKSLTANRIAELQSNLAPRKVDVYLPRFKFDASFSIAKTLEALGMKAAFNSDADFSRMDGQRDLFVSAVVHKAFVDVGEEGTEAAAATGVVVSRAPGPAGPRPVVFRADHPFVFMICDKRDGTILFLGRMMDPRASLGKAK
jgi:serpin B